MSNNLRFNENIQNILRSNLLEEETVKWSYLKQEDMLYAITNIRALIIKVSRKTDVQSFFFEELKMIGTVVHENGSGDLLFKAAEIRDSEMELISIDVSGFMGIEEVESVESILFQELKLFEGREEKTTDGFYENEKITWSCNPKPRLFIFETILKSISGFIIATFLTLFIFGAIYLILSNKDQQSPILLVGVFMLLSAIVFMVGAIKFMLSPIYLWLKDKKTSYIITNKRVLIVKKEKYNKYFTILPEKISITKKGRNNLILLSELVYDFDKQHYVHGIGFYRIPDVNEAIKWISPLLKMESGKELAFDKSELQNIRRVRGILFLSGLASLGFSLFFIFKFIMGIVNFIKDLKAGIGTFEEYLTVVVTGVLGCGLYLMGFVISAYAAYMLFYGCRKDVV